MIDHKDVNNLWLTRGHSQLKKPNTNLILKVGSKLNVDLVILYSSIQKFGKYNWDTTIYFIDVATKKTFSKNDSIHVRTFPNEVKRFTEQAFDAYSIKKLKSDSGSASETQVAATTNIEVKNKQPWTGIWNVEASYQVGGGVCGLK